MNLFYLTKKESCLFGWLSCVKTIFLLFFPTLHSFILANNPFFLPHCVIAVLTWMNVNTLPCSFSQKNGANTKNTTTKRTTQVEFRSKLIYTHSLYFSSLLTFFLVCQFFNTSPYEESERKKVFSFVIQDDHPVQRGRIYRISDSKNAKERKNSFCAPGLLSPLPFICISIPRKKLEWQTCSWKKGEGVIEVVTFLCATTNTIHIPAPIDESFPLACNKRVNRFTLV